MKAGMIVSKTALVVVLALANTGCLCSWLKAAQVRSQYIEQQTQNYVYPHALEEVWPQVRQMVFEGGYAQADKASAEMGAYTLETQWKWENNTSSRYLIQGIKVDDKSCKVNFTKTYQNYGQNGTTSSGGGRDSAMEFNLLKRVDPDKAAAIEAEAEKQAQMATAQ